MSSSLTVAFLAVGTIWGTLLVWNICLYLKALTNHERNLSIRACRENIARGNVRDLREMRELAKVAVRADGDDMENLKVLYGEYADAEQEAMAKVVMLSALWEVRNGNQ